MSEDVALLLVADESGPEAPGRAARRNIRDLYRRPVAEYDAVYGIKPNRGRSINRWIDVGMGKVPEDLPPLDEPHLMAAWWGRNMKWRVPDIMLRYASEHRPAPVAEESVPPPVPAAMVPEVSQAPAAATTPPAAVANGYGRRDKSAAGDQEDDLDDNSYTATLKRLQNAVGKAWKNKLAADEKEPPDPAAIELADRALDRAVKRYREFERDAEEILGREERAWSEVEKYFAEPLEVVNRSVRSAMVRVATKIGMPPEWFKRAEHAYQEELDTIFSTLADNDFTEPVRHREQLALEAA